MEGETIDKEVTSTQQSLSSTHDPGWNDPPKWAFSPTPNTGATPTKRLLNKRVAFPLSSVSPGVSLTNDQQPTTVSTPNLPPPVQCSRLTTAPHAPLSTPTGKIESSHSEVVSIDKQQALDETVENLESFIIKELESSSKIEEVRRRLDIMKIMWNDDKLKDDVCEKVLKISKALRSNDAEVADKIHVSLMMEHAAICNTWISGIRHMILELREKSSQASSTIVVKDSHPYLLPQTMNKSDEDQ